MVTQVRRRIIPYFVGLFLVVVLFGWLFNQPLAVSVQSNWTYPSSYDPHGGYVDRLTFMVYPSEDIAQALLALQDGSVFSYDERIPHQSVMELEANPAIEVGSEPGTIYRQFTLQCQRFPTNITGYRVALAHVLDKPTVVQNSRGGYAQMMDNPIPLAFEFWTYENQMSSHFYSEDIASANATLDAAHIIDTPDSPHPGWRYYDADMSGNWTLGDKRGDVDAPVGLKVEIWTSAGCGMNIQGPLLMITGMEKAGLQGEVGEVDFNALINGLNSGEFSIGQFSWNINPPGVPTLLYDMFHSESADNAFFYRYNNSEYDYNCTMFMNAPTRLEARNWAWNCCKILMAEMPMIVSYNEEFTHAYRTDHWEGYVNWVSQNRMGGNPYTMQQIRLKESSGGPYGCYPTEYVTVLSEGMDFKNTILSSSGYSHTIFNLIYSTLWRIDPLDPSSLLVPDLANNWTLEPTTASGDIQEGMKYTFLLYDNITWHDGMNFTSEDVQYSLMNIHPWGTYTAEKVASIYRVDTPDEYTVEIYSNATGYVTFTQATSVHILPKHIWEPHESGNFTWTPGTPNDLIGTGCFQWVTRVAGQYIILERYPEWHFAISMPPRPNCPLPIPYGPWPGIITGSIIILILILLLGYFLHQRNQHKGVTKT